MVGTEQQASSNQGILSAGCEDVVEVAMGELMPSGYPEGSNAGEDGAKEVIDRLAALGYLE